MNFDSEPSAVSSGEGEGVTGSENEPVWKRCSLICLVSITCAAVMFQSQCPDRTEIILSFQRAASTREARSIQDADDLSSIFLGSIGGKESDEVCVHSKYVEYEEGVEVEATKSRFAVRVASLKSFELLACVAIKWFDVNARCVDMCSQFSLISPAT